MKKAQLLKLKIYFLCCRVPYGVSGAAFYRKLRHEESSHNFRSQPVVVVFFIKLVQDQGKQNVVSYASEDSNDMVVIILPTQTQFCVGNKWFR